jgi:hypothetical protein
MHGDHDDGGIGQSPRYSPDRCLAHLGARCPTDVRLFGTADHCDAFLEVPFRGRTSSADCYFGDGSGLAEQRWEVLGR